jgi:uncharacterized protein
MTRPISSRLRKWPLAAVVGLCLVAILAGDLSVSPVQAQSSGEGIIFAQAQQERGGFFRFLFRNRRREAAPPPRAPIRLFPGFEQPQGQAAQPRRERKPRQVAPPPSEVAAVEKAPNAKRALVIGDFMATALAKGLADAYRENANALVIDASNGSSGLVRNDYYDWTGELPAIVEEQKPDAILVMVGSNDRQGIETANGPQQLGTEGWRTAYAARVAALADALKATGKPILWAGLVPVEPTKMSRDYSAFNEIVREQLEAKGLRFVDMWNGFADEEGQYVGAGPDINGQVVQLRSDDGLNFTRAGWRKLAYFVEQPLNDQFGGIGSLLASVDAGGVSSVPNPNIGPMVPFDALETMGGDSLSDRISESADRGQVAAEISASLTKVDATPPPRSRADSYLWPPPSSVVVPLPLPLRGPR